jgi:hypothetical protein
VDLWDLTKVLFHRWYVTVPMLILAAMGTLAVTNTVKPDFSSTGYLQLIPPANTTPDETKPGYIRNPWSDLGFNALAQAAIIKVQDHAVMDALVERGFTDSVILGVDERSPLLSIEAAGNSPAQATGTVRELMRLLDQQVKTQQSQYGVASADTITTLVLDDGSNVKVVTTKVKRVIIVAIAVGLLATVAVSIGIDAIFGRRSRRRSNPDAMASPAMPPLLPGPPPPVPSSRERTRLNVETFPIPAPVSPPVGPPVLPDRPLLSSATNGSRGSAGEPQIAVTYQRIDDTVVSERPRVDDSAHEPTNADATIVLPLSHGRWSSRDDEGKRR